MQASAVLPPDRLRRSLDPQALPWTTTADVPEAMVLAPWTTPGQARALEALDFGVSVSAPGWHLFVAGAEGSGRETTVRAFLDRVVRDRPTPPDLVYVHDFQHPDRPRLLLLPAGQGTALAQAMSDLLTAARRDIPRAFEGEAYARARQEATAQLDARREALHAALRDEAAAHDFGVHPTDTGLSLVPLRDGEPIADEAWAALPEPERRIYEDARGPLQDQAVAVLAETQALEQAAAARVAELDVAGARRAVGPLLEALRQRFDGLPEVQAWLAQVQVDIPLHIADFVEDEDEAPRTPTWLEPPDPRVRYRVNVLVDRTGQQGAPVVIEDNPTLLRLVGDIEHVARLGELETDVLRIRAGALHRACGGFLLLRAADVSQDEAAWTALKRALRSGVLRIDRPTDPGQMTVATLRPEPTPLDVKVVLLGPDELWQAACAADPDFIELFRVKVDFAPDVPWDGAAVTEYAAMASRWVRAQGLRHFDRGGLARLIEHAARLRGHQGRLTTRLRDLGDVMTEASFWADRRGHELVQADDVRQALQQRRRRSDLLEQQVREQILEGTVVVQTEGVAVGQVNALAVVQLGDLAFGRPIRATAAVGVGRGLVRSIEREVRLADPSHGKGVLALAGYLATRYGQEHALALGATLTLEQVYEPVVGDSSMLAELLALLSALAGRPASQAVAVTGAVDQHGAVQAVGSVNDKVEAFFHLCAARKVQDGRGLQDGQGVLLPAGNARHLMLDEAVVEAVAQGRFQVWAVATVDEAMALVFGVPAAVVHAEVAARLARFARIRQEDGHLPG